MRAFYMGLGQVLNEPDSCYDASSREHKCYGSNPTLFFLGLSLGTAF